MFLRLGPVQGSWAQGMGPSHTQNQGPAQLGARESCSVHVEQWDEEAVNQCANAQQPASDALELRTHGFTDEW